MTKKICIMGSRDFENYPALKMSVFQVIGLLKLDIKELVFNSGRARGADKLGEKFAKQINAPLNFYKPDWSKGRGAGIVRNKEMSNDSDIVIAMWDLSSKGSEHMIQYSKDKNKIVVVFDFNGKLVELYDPENLQNNV